MLVAGSFPPMPCGVGDYVAQLSRALAADSALEVAVLTREGSEPPPQSSVQVIDAAQSWRLGEMSDLLRRILEWRPDLVHLHFPSQGFQRRVLPSLLPLACRLCGMRVVQTWHEAWPLSAMPRLLAQRAGAHGLVFVRPNYRELLPKLFQPLLGRRLPQTTIVTATGVLPASTQTDAQRQALRERYLQRNQKLVVFFGFVYPAKGIEQLFRIADPANDALVVAGACNDSAYVGKLETEARELGWSSNLQFTGFLSECDAADLLAAADAVVLPFLEGSGDWNTSVHAALAQGTLVVTTSKHPAGDEPDRNLYTARIADVEEMRTALRNLTGRRAPPRSPAQAWESIARNHRAFYTRVVASNDRKAR